MGEMEVINHRTGDKCHLKYEPYSYFAGVAKKVHGTVMNKDDKVEWVVNGTWDSKFEGAKVIGESKGMCSRIGKLANLGEQGWLGHGRGNLGMGFSSPEQSQGKENPIPKFPLPWPSRFCPPKVANLPILIFSPWQPILAFCPN